MDFDLTIENYSLQDLIQFFHLTPETRNYTRSDIELIEYKLRTKILASGQLNKQFQRDLIEFLDDAKHILIENLCSKPKKQSSIPSNYVLDGSDGQRLKEEPSTRQGELVTKPTTPFVYSQPSEFFPGKLNPLDTRIVTKCLNIDSKYRKNLYSTDSSDFSIQLPIKFNKVVSMQLASFEFPLSFYSISSSFGNNFFYVQIQHYPIDGDGVDLSGSIITSQKIVNVAEGNYTASDFITTINTSFSAQNTDGSLVDSSDPFGYISFTLDINDNGSGTGRATLAPAGIYSNAITTIHLDFRKNKDMIQDDTPVSSRIGWNLGFIKPYYDASLNIVGETVVEPAQARYIYLAIEDFQNSSHNHFVNVFQESVLSPHILARISLKASYFSLLMENDLPVVSEPRKYFGPVDIQRLRIRLYDERGNVLNMNSSNWSFCLNFKMLYDL